MIFLRNLKVSLRQLLSQKLNSTVHIAGLSLGMTVCLLIGLFIRFELSFDNYHPDAERIYRINQVWTDNGGAYSNFSTPFPLADGLRQITTGLDNSVFTHQVNSAIIDVNDEKRFKQERILITDASFLDVFKVEVIKGNGHEVLRTPYQALLTESTARKFFGTEDPIGKTFRFRSKYDVTVGGVIRDLPANTHLPASMILSFVPEQGYLETDPNAWAYTSSTSTYVKIPEGLDMKILEAQLKQLGDERINSNPALPKLVRSSFTLQPISRIHLDQATRGSQWVPAVSVTWVWFFGTIGVMVLILACINFINLSTAQALTRAKEVGVRKSIGAGRTHLVFQFLGESWLLATISGIVAIGVAQVSLPYMNTLLEKQIAFEITDSPTLVAAVLIGVVFVGVLAGLYPAWIITRFSPAVSLRSTYNMQGDRGSSWLRRSLVVLQFVISAGLLMSLILISTQVNYMRGLDTGFNKDNIINVRNSGRGESVVFNHELEKIPQVEGWSYSTTPPSSQFNWGTVMSKTNGDDPERTGVNAFLGDDNFCTLYGFKLLAGRFPISSDTNLMSQSLREDKRMMKGVVNERLLEVLNLGTPEEAVGKHFWFGMSGDFEIVGIVSDFLTTSAHTLVGPIIIAQMPSVYGMTGIRVRPGSDVPSTIASIERAWKVAYPDGIFTYTFLDEQIDSYYKAEERVFQLFRIFSSLAMLISCLGLWGLITFTAQRRLKEIGIRKVLGATSASIVQLLSRDFFYMVLIALIIAGPLVYYGITQWLEAFAYHISIGWQAFVIAGFVSIALALITVGVQSLRATFTNPASILKSE